MTKKAKERNENCLKKGKYNNKIHTKDYFKNEQ